MNGKMKKYVYLLGLALALAGCSLEDPEGQDTPKSSSEGYELTFRVQREDDGLTRAAIAEGNAVAFQPGDKISVFDAEGNNCEFTQTGKIAEDGSATFIGKVQYVANSYLVLYPYTPDAAMDRQNNRVGTSGSDENRHPVIIKDRQTAVAGSFDPTAFISCAQSVKESNSVHSITFRNVCALVKFSIPESVGDLVFEKAVLESGTRVIAGSIQAMPDGTSSYIGPGSHTVTLEGAVKAGESYYFCVNPWNQVKGLSLSLYHYSFDDTPIAVFASAEDKEAPLLRNRVLDVGDIAPNPIPEKSGNWYGSGTAADPFQIGSKEHLSRMLNSLADSATFRSSHFRLSADIDCQGESMTVGNKRVDFSGVLDGNGHTIGNYMPSSYYWYDQGGNSYCALFHKVQGATFRNLTLRPSSLIKSDFYSYSYFSPLVGEALTGSRPTSIENCTLEGDVELSYNIYEWGRLWMGGFVGANSCDQLNFTNCTNKANFTFSENYHEELNEENYLIEHFIGDGSIYHIGGFVGHMYCGGQNSTTNFDRCRNTGNFTFLENVPAATLNVGGFVGHGSYAFIHPSTFSFTNCVNSGDIDIFPGYGSTGKTTTVYSAGFIAYNEIDGNEHYSKTEHMTVPRMYNCLNKGDISGEATSVHAAGFVYFKEYEGTNNNVQFALCVNIGDISAIAPSQKDIYKAAFSSGWGTCTWCWWREADKDHPVLKCTLNGLPQSKSDYPYYCYCYPTINANTPNNRRVGSDGNGGTDIVLDLSNSMWSNALWIANTVAWKGGSGDRSLDLDF